MIPVRDHEHLAGLARALKTGCAACRVKPSRSRTYLPFWAGFIPQPGLFV